MCISNGDRCRPVKDGRVKLRKETDEGEGDREG